jgi:hypothetical protein
MATSLLLFLSGIFGLIVAVDYLNNPHKKKLSPVFSLAFSTLSLSLLAFSLGMW